MARDLRGGWPSCALVLAVVAFVGCVSKPALVSQSFSIDPPPPPSGPPAADARVLWLGRVDVTPPYGGTEFTYDTGGHGIERDPYARFAAPPGSLLTAAIRGYLLSADFVRDVELPGGYVTADAIIEGHATELSGDLGSPSDSAAVLTLRFRVLAPASGTTPARELLLKSYSRRVRLPAATARAIAEAWNQGLAAIMTEFLADLKPVLPARRALRAASPTAPS